MKLVTFTPRTLGPDAQTRAGLLIDETVLDLSDELRSQGDTRCPARSAVEVLVDNSWRQSALRLWREAITGLPENAAVYRLADVSLGPPVPAPGKLVCIGLNYREHAREAGSDIADVPTIFAKFPNAIVGSGHPIVIPLAASNIDWEGELAFIVGSRARAVSMEDALEYVAGYTVMNDVSARDFQYRTSQWMLGKTFDTFAPMGPCLVDAASISDPQQLFLQTTVNGEMKQSASMSDMIFSVAELLSFLSNVMTLEPGDVVSTGTPSGVGAAQTPPQWLRDGDVVRIDVEQIGSLVNPVVSAASDELTRLVGELK